ncbi:MFS transporter [Pedobacter jamesrossensis]|uniref:MFS transporter n=1 Tax=Pedobacter jamesrossensis TaxID=1908238 RepID=UPI0036071A46
MLEGAKRGFIIAWVLGLVFYFLEYVARSSPAVMIPQLSDNFKISTLMVSTVLGTYYYTYSVTSLIAGICLDRFGGRYPISLGTLTLSAGCLIFASHSLFLGDLGRLLQGAGSAFAFTGCVYLAAHGFSSKYLATAIGFTQCMGMLGGSVGQFAVGKLVHGGLSIGIFWLAMGIICAIVGLMMFFVIPKEQINTENRGELKNIFIPYKIVFSNTQSYLSGLISGLLFAPTTIFAMTWGWLFSNKIATTLIPPPYWSALWFRWVG